MSARTVTINDVLASLTKAVERAGSQRAVAKQFGVSVAYVSDVLRRRRDPGESILTPLGYRKEARYVVTYTYTRRGDA